MFVRLMILLQKIFWLRSQIILIFGLRLTEQFTSSYYYVCETNIVEVQPFE